MAVLLLAGVAACALHPRSGDSLASRGDDIVITDSMIAASGAQTAWEIVKREAPQISYRETSAGEPARAWRRGRGSIVLNESPLLFVDGVRISDLRHLDQIPAATVQSIRILTGLNGTTQYGTNAGNGVILVQTRTGT